MSSSTTMCAHTFACAQGVLHACGLSGIPQLLHINCNFCDMAAREAGQHGMNFTCVFVVTLRAWSSSEGSVPSSGIGNDVYSTQHDCISQPQLAACLDIM